MQLYELMLKDSEQAAALPKKNHCYRRGNYTAVGAGITFAPGDRMARNFSLEESEKASIYRTSERRWKIKSDIRGFLESTPPCAALETKTRPSDPFAQVPLICLPRAYASITPPTCSSCASTPIMPVLSSVTPLRDRPTLTRCPLPATQRIGPLVPSPFPIVT